MADVAPVSKQDRQRVYVLCRAIFSGHNAQVRQLKKVRKLVNDSQSSLRPLLAQFGESRLVEILRQLLEARIFESELRAKVEFPDLFRPSPARDERREASEIDAARSVAEALDEAVSDGEALKEVAVDEDDDVDSVETAEVTESMVVEDNAGTATRRKESSLPVKLPSLYPSYLPYKSQHLILNTAQRVLEECCFEFGLGKMPSLLSDKKWDCPAAAELTQWTRVFHTNKGKLPLHKLSPALGIRKAQELLVTVSNLRHTAVHRLPTTARGVSQLLSAAQQLAQVLGDSTRAAQLEELKSEVDGKVKAMELNKNVLEDYATRQLLEIQLKREELDRMEAETVSNMLRDDADNRALVGSLLEETIDGIFSVRREEEKVDAGKEPVAVSGEAGPASEEKNERPRNTDAEDLESTVAEDEVAPVAIPVEVHDQSLDNIASHENVA